MLSFASLSLVSSCSKEFVKKALQDLFAALIETSRKTSKEARINMKGFGTLYLFKNRELAFNPEDDSLANLESLGGPKGTDLFLARQREREDLSFIDNASAIISIGGGRAYSMKSSTLKTLSMVTPPSNPSVASSVFKSQKSTTLRSSISSHYSKSKTGRLNPLKQDLIW